MRSAATESAIIDAAAKILDDKGFDGFTIEAVAREARASKPTIYRWWGDKVRLMLDTHHRTRKVVDEAPDIGSVRADLIFLLKKLWRNHWSVESNAELSRALMAQALLKGDLSVAYRDDYLSKRAAPFLKVFEQAKARGELAGDMDTNMCWEMLLSFQLYRLMVRDPLSDEEIETYIDSLMHSTLKRTP